MCSRHVVKKKYRPAARKTAKNNVNNYIRLNRGINRPDCTYKTAKIILCAHLSEVESHIVVDSASFVHYTTSRDDPGQDDFAFRLVQIASNNQVEIRRPKRLIKLLGTNVSV